MNTQTIATTLSIANQTAVPSHVRKALNLKKGDKLIWKIDKKTSSAKITALPKDWGTYLAGLGKEIWQNTDTDKYIQELRQDRNTE